MSKIAETVNYSAPDRRYDNYKGKLAMTFPEAFVCRKCGQVTTEYLRWERNGPTCHGASEAANAAYIAGRSKLMDLAERINSIKTQEQLEEHFLELGDGVCSHCGEVQPWGKGYAQMRRPKLYLHLNTTASWLMIVGMFQLAVLGNPVSIILMGLFGWCRLLRASLVYSKKTYYWIVAVVFASFALIGGIAASMQHSLISVMPLWEYILLNAVGMLSACFGLVVNIMTAKMLRNVAADAKAEILQMLKHGEFARLPRIGGVDHHCAAEDPRSIALTGQDVRHFVKVEGWDDGDD